jgi:hypothetical protein
MHAPAEGLSGAVLVGGVLQMVSEPTLVVACTGYGVFGRDPTLKKQL